MAAVTKDTSSTDRPVTVSRSSSSSSTAAPMASSDLSQTWSVSSATASSEHELREALESPSTDSHDGDGQATSTGKWSFTPYPSENLCSPAESCSSCSTNETDNDCYTTYSVDEGGAPDARNTARVQGEFCRAEIKVQTAKDKLERLLQLQPLTQTKDFSRCGTDPPANQEGKPRAEPRHWATLQRYAAAMARETAEILRCEREVAHRTAELALLRFDLSTGVGAKEPASGPGGKFTSDLENGSLSLVYRGREFNKPP